MPIILISFIAGVLSFFSAVLAEGLTSDIPLLGDVVRLSLMHNRNIAFGIGLPYPLKGILIAGAFIAILILAFRSRQEKIPSVAFGLIIGGAIANLIDRIPDGAVTDYIAVGSFPIFNIADACITIGAGILIVESLRKRQ